MIGRGHTHSRFESTHIDMVPMVDCIMVLLIFLMISSAFVNDPGIEVQKPDVGGTQLNEQNSLLIAIAADNRIFFDGQQVSADQVAALVKRDAFGVVNPGGEDFKGLDGNFGSHVRHAFTRPPL